MRLTISELRGNFLAQLHACGMYMDSPKHYMWDNYKQL